MDPSIVQALEEVKSLIKKHSRTDLEKITDSAKEEFMTSLLAYHSVRGSRDLPSPPSFGDKKLDLLTLFLAVKEFVGPFSQADTEDLLAIAKFLKIKVHAIQNGLATLRAAYETFLTPIELEFTFPLRVTSIGAPAQFGSSASLPVDGLILSGELKPWSQSAPLFPAILPHAGLDLHRMTLGIQLLELPAFRALEIFLAAVGEGRVGEPRLEELNRVGAVLSKLVGNFSEEGKILRVHALNCLGLLVMRGVVVDSLALKKCSEFLGSDKWSAKERVLAGRVLMCKPGNWNSLALAVLEFESEPSLLSVAIGLLIRGIHQSSNMSPPPSPRGAPNYLSSREIVFELLPHLGALLAKSDDVLLLRGLGLLHLVLEFRASEISEKKIFENCIVGPLVMLLEKKSHQEVREAALSCILKIGVHMEIRTCLLPWLDRLSGIAWNGGEGVPMQSLFNVVTELLTS